MTDQIIAREISPGLWQWGRCDEDGQLENGTYQSGDSEAMVQEIPSSIPLSLVLRGQHIVSTEVSIDAAQRKHAAKLIPFELEDELSASVDDLHFAFAHGDGEAISVLYTDQEKCSSVINDISEHGCDINTALPDYLSLYREEGEVVLLLEAGVLSARLSEHWGFSVEHELAPLVLSRIANQSAFAETPPERIKLVADSKPELTRLQAMLPEAWEALVDRQFEGSFWDCIDINQSASALNLRRGALGRSLPFDKWLSFWKFPAIVLGVAFVCALLVNLFAFFSAKSEESALREQINAVYLDAIPNGRLGDVEGILESKLKSVRKTTSEPSNFTFLLSKMVKAIGKDSGVEVTSFSYSGDQRAIQLTVEFESLDTLTKVRTALTNSGIHTDSPRTTSLGDGYQARMKLREKE